MDMRFGTWNVRSLYKAGSLMTVAREISKYELDLVGVQVVRWDRGGTEPACFLKKRSRTSASWVFLDYFFLLEYYLSQL
jgi:hypothetical protein